MFDPQTSGGLLLSVSEAAAPGLLMQIKKSGFTSAKIIGRVTDTPGVIELS
jgi:hydrogenase maturation factor